MGNETETPIEEAVAPADSIWERQHREDMELRSRALDLEERRLALAERDIENGPRLTHSGSIEQLGVAIQAYFNLPTEMKEFRLREEAAGIAARALSGTGMAAPTPGGVLELAEQIFNWVKGEAW